MCAWRYFCLGTFVDLFCLSNPYIIDKEIYKSRQNYLSLRAYAALCDKPARVRCSAVISYDALSTLSILKLKIKSHFGPVITRLQCFKPKQDHYPPWRLFNDTQANSASLLAEFAWVGSPASILFLPPVKFTTQKIMKMFFLYVGPTYRTFFPWEELAKNVGRYLLLSKHRDLQFLWSLSVSREFILWRYEYVLLNYCVMPLLRVDDAFVISQNTVLFLVSIIKRRRVSEWMRNY